MSFSHDAKIEVIENEVPIEKHCCIAELSGVLRTCCIIQKNEDKYSIDCTTELDSMQKRLVRLLKTIYEQDFVLDVQQEERPNHNIRLHIHLPTQICEQVLRDCYMLRADYSGVENITYAVSRYLLENDCCQRSFIRGVFIGCASANIVIKDINDLKKHTGGYHLEFVFSNPNFAGDFSHILSQYGIYSKSIKRKRFNVIYIKEAELVSDVLALVGANNAVLTLQNEFAVREVRNKLNRQLNCMNSNMSKMIEASLKQIDAIEYLSETIGLETLPDNLYELCMLRLANPEETLDNLAKLMNPALTKSGVNHRLRKIVKMADDLRASYAPSNAVADELKDTENAE